MSGQVFISHSSKDDDFVRELREALEGLGVRVWVDSRELRGGSKLAPEIEAAIEGARQFVAVISPNTVNSPWVRREIQKALEVEARRKGEGYRVVPLLLPGIEPSALPNWFDVEPVGVNVEVRAGGLGEAMPAILAALGERMPDDRRAAEAVAPRPVEELILRLEDLKVETRDGKRRARAVAQLVYEPASAAPAVESKRFNFVAPLGVIEAEELRWYLEDFYVWPIGIFQERAARVEARLPEWGRDLYGAAFEPQAAPKVAHDVLGAWQRAGGEKAERRFSVLVEKDLPEGSPEEEQAAADEAAAELLALPWELLHDGRSFLFLGARPVRVRRRLPNRYPQPVIPTRLPIRILLVSPRPEDALTPYIDHRISARPLVEALETLGQLAKLSILTPPTFPALERALREADERGESFDVVHFDGHGVYDRRVGLGGLCFEEPKDEQDAGPRAVDLVHAERLAGLIRDRRIPLVFLEACQTAKTEDDPTASVAAKLLEEGVASVVAMSHTVLVETARRFVKAFYKELAQGRRVGTAMIEGQRELERDDYRGKLMGAGDLRLKDWFVPVLYQEEQDPQLVTKLPPAEVRELQEKQRRLSLGRLPDPPPHDFQGRSRELLALERLLSREPYAVIRGRGGEGKTTLAVELARWLVRTNRHARAAFVSFEQYTDARGVLISLGQQLLPEGDDWHVAPDEDMKAALRPVERALRDRSTVIVLDNLESVLPDKSGRQPAGAAPIDELFDLCRDLLGASPNTRIIFTTREPMPAPFDDRRREIALGALSREDAVALVGEVMKQHGLTPKSDDPGSDPKEITDLVEAVDRHARALVLLARELARTGVRATTENLHRLMADLHARHPNDRENSLYASLELSLRRLPPETREQIKVLAVFHGGAHLGVLAQMLNAEPDVVGRLAGQLIEVGLAEDMGYGHLRIDPALPSYMLRGTSEAEQEELRASWAGGMFNLIDFVSEQWFENVDLAARLTRLELPNILSMLSWAQQKAAPEATVRVAQSVESLLSTLGLRQALAHATAVREHAARRLGEWSSAVFLAAGANIDRLMESGDLRSAYVAAQQLLQRCQTAGPEAYPGAEYDIAWAHLKLGGVLRRGGASDDALLHLSEAQRRFQALADKGSASAESMAAVVISEVGICLTELGRQEEAAEALQESIRRAEKLGDKRKVAVSQGNLGTVRLHQGQYAEALKMHAKARDIFESLGEPGSVAVSWHQIGQVHQNAGQFDQAERAYRQSLAINVQQKDIEGEAASLYELGNIYSLMERLEEAVSLYRQVADICVKLNNPYREGMARNSLAGTLGRLQRYDEARRELHRAVECKEPYGHAAEIWKTWHILQELEQASGNSDAAHRARQRAIESYSAYRRAGGQSINPGAQLCAMTAQAIGQKDSAELEQLLVQVSGGEVPPSAKVLIAKLQAILKGQREPVLADDPELDYDDAVELRLLLESLRQT